MRPGIIFLVVAVILVFCIVFSGCTQEFSGIIPSAGTSSKNQVIDANNQFTFDLYSRLAGDAKNEDTNLVFSPWSVSSAIAVTYEGARNKTADEIRNVFHFPESRDELRSGYFAVISEQDRNHPSYTLTTANALWAEKSYPFRPDYSQIVQRSYDASTETLDFIHDAEGSRNSINSWVAKKTDQRVTNLVSEGTIQEDTRLILTNAIYFNGKWVKPFNPARTMDEKFTLSSGKTVPVRMMARTDGDPVFRLGETDQVQILEMPYINGNGNGVSMFVLLPKEKNLDQLEKTLDARRFSDLKKNMTLKFVLTYIPKFRLDTKYQLSQNLARMGMPTAFTLSADLSGMDGTQNLMIDEVIHHSTIDVNEVGTVASGTSEAEIIYKAQEVHVPVFRADHPFIFIIQDTSSGNILFMGRVMNPNE